MTEYSIDRIEGQMVLLVGPDGRERLVDAVLFDSEPKEGDIVVMQNGYFVPRPERARAKRAENNALLRRVLAQQQCFEPDAHRDDSADMRDSVGFEPAEKAPTEPEE